MINTGNRVFDTYMDDVDSLGCRNTIGTRTSRPTRCCSHRESGAPS